MPIKKRKLIPPAKREEHNKSLIVEEAIKQYNSRNYPYVAVYGVDEDTKKFIRGIWENPSVAKVILVDPSPERASEFSQEMAGKRFSLHRWTPMPAIGFFSDNSRWPLVVVSEEEAESVRKGPKAKGIIVRTIKQLSEGKFG
jgi:hypothetical protein